MEAGSLLQIIRKKTKTHVGTDDLYQHMYPSPPQHYDLMYDSLLPFPPSTPLKISLPCTGGNSGGRAAKKVIQNFRMLHMFDTDADLEGRCPTIQYGVCVGDNSGFMVVLMSFEWCRFVSQ